jgi:mRNA interferase MazF
LPEAAGLGNRAWVKISQIRTLSTERLGKRIGRATPELLDQLVEGLNKIVAG